FEKVMILAALADNLIRQGKPRDAESHARRAVAEGRAVDANDPFLMMPGLLQLAQVHMMLGDLPSAQQLLQEAKQRVRVLPAHHSMVLDLGYHMAGLAQLQGDAPTMERIARDCVYQTRELGETHPNHTCALAYLASVLNQLGNFEESEQLFN